MSAPRLITAAEKTTMKNKSPTREHPHRTIKSLTDDSVLIQENVDNLLTPRQRFLKILHKNAAQALPIVLFKEAEQHLFAGYLERWLEQVGVLWSLRRHSLRCRYFGVAVEGFGGQPQLDLGRDVQLSGLVQDIFQSQRLVLPIHVTSFHVPNDFG